MHFICQPKKFRFILGLIAVSVFLRSFIAPGYMLKTSAEDGLGIIFCDGPVSLYLSQDEHTGHIHHGSESDIEKEIHISPICSQWSTSSVLVFNTAIDPVKLYVIRSEKINHYSTPGYQEYSDPVHTIRGPPHVI